MSAENLDDLPPLDESIRDKVMPCFKAERKPLPMATAAPER